MCFRVQCSTCGLATYGGCGRHAAAVMANIPEHERCRCRGGYSAPPPPPAFPTIQKTYEPEQPVRKVHEPVLSTPVQEPKKKQEPIITKVKEEVKIKQEPRQSKEFSMPLKKSTQPLLSKLKEESVTNYKEQIYEEIKKANQAKFTKPREEPRTHYREESHQKASYSVPIKKTNQPIVSTGRDHHKPELQQVSGRRNIAARNILENPSYGKSSSLNKPSFLRTHKYHDLPEKKQPTQERHRNFNIRPAPQRAANVFSRPSRWAYAY